MPATAALRPFTARELSQLHIALAARLAELERVRAAEPDMVTPELLDMVRAIDHEVTEARRPL